MLVRGNAYRHQPHTALRYRHYAHNRYGASGKPFLYLLIVLAEPDLRGSTGWTTVVVSPTDGDKEEEMGTIQIHGRWAFLIKGDKNGGYGAAILTGQKKAGDIVNIANRYGAITQVQLGEVVRKDAANPAMGKAEEEVWTTTKV